MLKLQTMRLHNLNFVFRSRIACSSMGVDFYHFIADKGLHWALLNGETDNDVKYDSSLITMAVGVGALRSSTRLATDSKRSQCFSSVDQLERLARLNYLGALLPIFFGRENPGWLEDMNQD